MHLKMQRHGAEKFCVKNCADDAVDGASTKSIQWNKGSDAEEGFLRKSTNDPP
jgi:hypothetical protein